MGISPPLRLTVLQFRPHKGAVERNLSRVREEVARTAGRADLLILPETALSGYFLEGGVEEAARTAAELAACLGTPPDRAPDLVVGCYERDGDGLYNSALHLTPEAEEWRLVHRHRKSFLPTYGVFDEGRFVTPGREISAYDTRFGRMGLLICEEMLHSLPPTILALAGARLLLALSATPARDYTPGAPLPGNLERWDVAGRAIAMEHGLHLVAAHLIGSEGGRLFAGGSTAYGPRGEIVARAPLFREARLDIELPGEDVRRTRVRAPLLEDLRSALPHMVRALERVGSGAGGGVEGLSGEGAGQAHEAPGAARAPGPDPKDRSVLELDLPLVEEALVFFLREEIREGRGFDDVVLGLSGGVDSAVSAALAVRALGPEHVHAFLLPYATSSPESIEHGRLVADRLGLRVHTLEITAGVDAYVDALDGSISDLRRGNLAARFRAMVLWDQAARLGAIPLGTGNKSERLLGYFTWHADDAPPVNPLGDLFKTQVLALARTLDIPPVVVEKAPSADLVRGVHDEAELGIAYARADLILHWLISGVSPVELREAGFDPGDVELVSGRLHGTHWKRALPTVAMVSSTAVGGFYLRPVDYRGSDP